MSSHVDTVIIGGGLLGCATAWMLAQEGGSILLAERDQINQHASGQNAGSLHFQLEYRMMEHGVEAAKKAAEAMPLHLEAAELWQGITDASGEEIEVTQTGGLMLAESAEQARILERKVAIEQGWGLDVRMLDQREVQSVAPYLTENIVAAAFCPVEGKADTRTAGPALARAAIREGASVETRTEVVNIRRDGRRWRLTLRTDAGERDVFSDAVVIAAGVWTTEIGKLIGVDLPTIAVALQMTVSLKVPKFIDHLVQHAGERLSLKQSLDGNVLIGGGWPAKLPHTAGGAPDFSRKPKLLQSSLAGNARVASRVVPQVAEIPMLRSWSGVTTVTPDQLPLVGPVPNAPGVFVATGGSAFTLG
ncbi:FAD-dependent oxidoreductase, partial [Staphylococcus aureus]